MPSYCNLTNIASGIYSDLDSPSDISISSVSNWIKNNIGAVNNSIFTNYSITGDLFVEASGCPDDEEVSIINSYYNTYYYGKLIKSNLGAAGFSAVTEVNSDGGKVKLVNKTELAKVYRDLQRDEQGKLDKLITNYRLNKSRPGAVHGDDTEWSMYNGAE